MPTTIPLERRLPGVRYARTAAGLELPLVDLSHPSFALNVEEVEVAALRARDRAEFEAWSRKPAFLQRLLFSLVRRRSVLLQGLRDSEGSFLSGLNTYLMKLGPTHLDRSFAKPLDWKIASSVPALNVRLRLSNMAQLLAEALAPALDSGMPRPIRLINLAGGPAMDSLNALIRLRQSHGHALAQAFTRIQVLDLDAEGPAFGARALEAFRASGGPLDGVDARLEHHRYDWRRPETLATLLGDSGDAIVAGSTEGGLFEYARDEEILGNLEALHSLTPASFTLSGSTTLDFPYHRARQHTATRLATRMFEAGQLEALVARASWRMEKRLEGPTTVCFRLAKN